MIKLRMTSAIVLVKAQIARGWRLEAGDWEAGVWRLETCTDI